MSATTLSAKPTQLHPKFWVLGVAVAVLLAFGAFPPELSFEFTAGERVEGNAHNGLLGRVRSFVQSLME